MSSTATQRRPVWQFSLQSLMVLLILLSLSLGIYRHNGIKALATYGLLLMAVGPWFAFLAGECLAASVALRRTVSHGLLLVIFAVGLWSSHVWRPEIDSRLAIWLMPAALSLWVPQYLAFFVFHREEG
jgi:glycerol-3-phosphate acyltransferase PlsY